MTINRKTFLRQIAGAAALAGTTTRGLGAAEQMARPLPQWNDGDPRPYFRAVRDLYDIARDPVYLNAGGLGPSPRPVLEKYAAVSRQLQQRVETGHELHEEARGVLADFIGATADEVSFTRNATEGNSIIAAGLDLKRGDEVVFESHAHPGGALPWLNQARLRGVVIRTFEPALESAAANLERLSAQLSPRTRVIQVSHITATTGLVLPVRDIARIAKERGAWFHVDGAQSLGHLPVNLREMDCDSYAASGHKWLGGPRETGVLFIRRDRIDEVNPQHVGAYSSADFDFSGVVHYTIGARRHEYGTRNAAAVVAMAEAARLQREIGIIRIADRLTSLARRVREGLSQATEVRLLGPRSDAGCGMVTFALPGWDAAKLFGALLRDYQHRCRPVTEAGLQAVRVSTHLFNDESECDRVVQAVRKLAT